MPVKVVFKGAKERDFFVVAGPDMLKEWRDDHFVPLEVVLTGKYYSHMKKNVTCIFEAKQEHLFFMCRKTMEHVKDTPILMI